MESFIFKRKLSNKFLCEFNSNFLIVFSDILLSYYSVWFVLFNWLHYIMITYLYD